MLIDEDKSREAGSRSLSDIVASISSHAGTIFDADVSTTNEPLAQRKLRTLSLGPHLLIGVATPSTGRMLERGVTHKVHRRLRPGRHFIRLLRVLNNLVVTLTRYFAMNGGFNTWRMVICKNNS
jgi:hypothetical protein